MNMKEMIDSTEDHTIPHLNITFNFNLFDIVTDRKESVCLSVQGGVGGGMGRGCLFPSMHHRSHDWGGSASRGPASRGSTSKGSVSRGCLHPGGFEQNGKPWDMVNNLAVRILLECFLV